MNERYSKLRVLVGAALMNIPTCIPMIYGNLFTYVFSFFYCLSVPDANTLDPDRLLGLQLVATCVGSLALDDMRTRFGLRITAAIGMAFTTSSYFLTYFTVQWSVWATAFTLMILAGVGDGLLANASFIYTDGWFKDKSVGLAASMVSGATGVGAYVINIVLTEYINPDNLSPDAIRGEMSYFTQTRIVNRVPMAFVVVGLVSAVCQIVGFCMLKEPTDTDSEQFKQKDLKYSKKGQGVKEHNVCRSSCDSDGNNSVGIDKSIALKENKHLHTSLTENGNCPIDVSGFSESSIRVEADNTVFPCEKSVIIEKTTKGRMIPNANDKSPKDLLRMQTFYIIWFSAFAESLGCMITATYYKIFGQLFIADDILLGVIGSMSCLLAIVSRLLCGHLVDRLGVKNVLVIHTALSCVLHSLWYFTARWSKWCYFLWTNVLSAVYFNHFYMYPILCLKMFGPSRFGSNMVLFMVPYTFVAIVMPTLTSFVLRVFGWFWLFFSVSLTVFASFIVLVTRMPS